MRTKIVLIVGIVVAIALFLGTRGRALPLGIHTLHADDSAMQQVRDLGGQYVVQVFSWSEIEPTRGEFHWEYTDWLLRAADYYRLRVVARLDETPRWATSSANALDAPPDQLVDYATFVAQVAARYRGRIPAYIIWNEPNLAREWGNRPPDPAAYAALLKTASASIRTVDPAARTVSAGLAPTNDRDITAMDDRDFLRALYAAGARDSFDILGAHPYAYANRPDDPRGAHAGLNFLRLLDLRDIMTANGDAAKPVWITEFGYPTETPPETANLRVGENDQAHDISRAYEMAREQMPFVQLFTVWNLTRGVGTADPQAGYSLLRADGSPKPAFGEVQAMQKESPAASLAANLSSVTSSPAALATFPILARDSVIHLGEKDYPLPWVPLYLNRDPSTQWTGEFYLNSADLPASSNSQAWRLALELMQVNDMDNRVLVNDQPVDPPFLPTEDFTSIWVSAQFQVPAQSLHVGLNRVTLLEGKLFPAFQQTRYTWDDFQFRNVVIEKPEGF